MLYQILLYKCIKCFVVFQVDVAVIEAGIGGAYDPTNIMP